MCVQANIHSVDDYGWTALHVAAGAGHVETVQLLLGRRAALDTVDRNGLSALDWAKKKGRSAVVHLLLNRVLP